MVPAGYMYKSIMRKPHWLNVSEVRDVYSVSGCLSKDFCDWVGHWKHNGFWLFDSLLTIEQIAAAEGMDLSSMTPFYYRVYPYQWDRGSGRWLTFEPDPAFSTAVSPPGNVSREGFDVVTYSAQTAAECSPLSCNHYAEKVLVNAHCLLERFEDAKAAIEAGTFSQGEPGPHRILEVNTVGD